MDDLGYNRKKNDRPYFQLPNYEFKNIVVRKMTFFRNPVQYSQLSSASWVDGQK